MDEIWEDGVGASEDDLLKARSERRRVIFGRWIGASKGKVGDSKDTVNREAVKHIGGHPFVQGTQRDVKLEARITILKFLNVLTC